MENDILICDDDVDTTELLAIALRSKGFKVSYVNDCEKIWDLIGDSPPKIILMDIHVPMMGGRAAAIALKKEYGEKIRIYIISGESGIEKVAEETLADGYIKKPFRVEELLALLQRENSR